MAVILEDNFNAYNDGDLNGQGSWSAHANVDVQGGSADNPEGASSGKEIKDSVEHTTTGNKIEKDGTARAAGRHTFYFKVDGAGTHYVSVGIYLSSNVGGFAGALRDGSFDMHNGTDWVIGKSYSLNVWHYGQVEWKDDSPSVARLNIDGGAWTNWEVTQGDRDTLDRIHFNFYTIAAGQTIYLDYIAEDPIPAVGQFMTLNTRYW